ncbi:hypothetical protein GCM10027597_18170 [Saccharopolyspora tripterygii]
MIQFLVALALCYVLIKIPFWILGSLRGGGGRSLVGGLVRGFITYKTFGLLRGMGGGGGGKSARSRGGQKSPESPDPYATTRATANGQYMLPLNVKRVRKPTGQRPTPQSSSRSRPARQGKQLELPLDGEWPENRPRLGRDGQYQLPLNVQRQPKPKPAPEPAPERKDSTGPRGRQMPFPLDGEWPENKPRLGRYGQYRLPIEVQRVRRPAPPPEPPKPTRPATRGRQTKLPADGEWPENKPRAGRDGQYQLPLNAQRTRKPPRSQPQAPPPPPQRPGPRQQELPLNLPKLHPPRPSTGRKGGDRT